MGCDLHNCQEAGGCACITGGQGESCVLCECRTDGPCLLLLQHQLRGCPLLLHHLARHRVRTVASLRVDRHVVPVAAAVRPGRIEHARWRVDEREVDDVGVQLLQVQLEGLDGVLVTAAESHAVGGKGLSRSTAGTRTVGGGGGCAAAPVPVANDGVAAGLDLRLYKQILPRGPRAGDTARNAVLVEVAVGTIHTRKPDAGGDSLMRVRMQSGQSHSPAHARCNTHGPAQQRAPCLLNSLRSAPQFRRAWPAF
jgi:hypothetical protein